MINALRCEVVRLRTLRSTWWLLATSLVITTGVAVLFAGLSATHGYQGNLVPALTTLGAQAIPVQALLVGLVGAFAIGHEHRYGTIRLTLAVLPRRTTVVLAKIVVVVEPILGFITFIPGVSSLRPATKYLPFNAGQQLLAVPSTAPAQGNGPGTLPQLGAWAGGLDMAILTVVLLLAWWIAFRSSDA